ncbi:MAG: hypothetical protein OXN44_00455 [Acidimicrobiaceae bacterium]|nr:hypothetical protein [Acidimicrobiaceae bacterium]
MTIVEFLSEAVGEVDRRLFLELWASCLQSSYDRLSASSPGG